MKKSALIIVIMLMVVACFSLTACNSSTPQGQLGNYFAPYEKFVYDVAHTTDDGVINGTYTIEIEQFDGGDIAVGDVLVKNQPSGHIINSYLDIDGTQIESSCFFVNVSSNSFYVPRSSFRKVIVDGTESYRVQINYTSSGAKYTLSENGKAKKTGTLEISSPFYDNTEFYTMLRGASTMGTAFSMSYGVAIVAPNEIAVATLSASCTSTKTLSAPEKAFKDGKVSCYKTTVTRSTTVAGISYTVYYATSSVTSINGSAVRSIVRPIVKIVEGDVVYTLSDISAVKGEI